jgi:uncharacterized membrane protein
MWEWAVDLWGELRESFWFLPTCIVLCALALAPVSIALDHNVFSTYDSKLFWIFGGKADAARTLLSVIASSLITVVAVAFSVTIVAVQQAASQYSPRILKNFMRDRVNQIILGTYIATFGFALIVLSDIRSGSSGQGATSDSMGFVPGLSVMLTMVLAMLSLGMLVYFIHHVTLSLQVSTILTKIRSDLDREAEQSLWIEGMGSEAEEQTYESLEKKLKVVRRDSLVEIFSKSEGYIRRIDVPRIVEVTSGLSKGWIALPFKTGDYVLPGAVIVRISTENELSASLKDELRETVRIGRERSTAQDPLFAIRQIVDIAVKALSPGVNDPTTAEECVTSLEGFAASLITKRFSDQLFTSRQGAFLVRRPIFSEVIDHCFTQIRRNCQRDIHVSFFLIHSLEKLARLSGGVSRRAVFKSHLQCWLEELEGSGMGQYDREQLRRRLVEVLDSVSSTESG